MRVIMTGRIIKRDGKVIDLTVQVAKGSAFDTFANLLSKLP